MQQHSSIQIIEGVLGHCGGIEVFLGFAPASLLHAISFADVLNEETGDGYQRPPNKQHSRDFSRYIAQPRATTIPLTFNLRADDEDAWEIQRNHGNWATLLVDTKRRCMAQVDCQHRLGELQGAEVSLAFMTFIGLDLRDEMAIFSIINSKARGLSNSLTDYHQSNLLDNLVEEAPNLYIARRLNDDPRSPWHRLIRCGGQSTSGLKRRTSLRMIQKTIARFLKSVQGVSARSADDWYGVIVCFWRAVQRAFPQQWQDHRHHLITKGVGLYALMLLLGDFVRNADRASVLDEEFFIRALEPLRRSIDWTSNGAFANAGGQKGAMEVHAMLRKATGI